MTMVEASTKKTPKRRSARGLGSIRKKDNSAWEVRVTVGGRSISRTTAPGATKTEAEALRRELLKLDPRKLAAPRSSFTVAEAVTAFLADAEHRMARATRDQYASLLGQHLVERFGAQKIAKLKPAGLRALLADARQKKSKPGVLPAALSPRSKQALYIALQQLEKFALAERWIAESFLDGVTKPRLDRREAGRVRVWTAEEARDFLRAAEEHVPTVYPLFVLMLELGPRIGEALGLRWRDLDLREGVVTIAGRLDKHGDWGPPKTVASRRTLHLSPRLVRLLRAREKANERGLDAWVFPSSSGGPMLADNLRKREWAKTIDLAGVPRRTPHEARHTCASLLLGAGEPVLSVSRLLGHEDVSTTLSKYGHLLPGAEKATAARMASLLS